MGSMGKMQATPDFAQQREAAQRLGERMTAGMGGNYRSEGSYGGRGAMDKYPGEFSLLDTCHWGLLSPDLHLAS